ncbi:uncharacterized protein LOC131803728 isoform X1 [Musca domestica]|uniref:Uncharacterized protein LOC131803728 isoform X1 n=1 Tax=Musca domestica TaxID=7370 RepID=A0ABM3V6B8_MUSDO|nr:uncharacterized protein LOC131803728 isoform X1 [Musca domestica]
MAKVKAASRKSKKSPATKKNIKGETTTCNANENEQYAYLNDYYEIQSKIRLCFVKIKRDKRLNNAAVSRGGGGVDGGNGDGCTKDDDNGSETQAQCTNEIVCKALEDRVNDVTAIDKTIPCVGTREMKGNILDKSPGESEVFELSSPSKETSCQSLGSEITLPPRQKLRRCKVRIKRMRKIQTVYTTAKFSNKFSQKCRVKIPKTPMPLQRSAPAAAELTAVAALEDAKLATSLLQIENPALDQEKRQAFTKLSLTKRKSDQFNPASKENTSNQDEFKDQDKENRNEISEQEKTNQDNLKLSSKAKAAIRNTRTMANISNIHFVPQRNSTMVFEHFIETKNTDSTPKEGRSLKRNGIMKANKKDRNNNENEANENDKGKHEDPNSMNKENVEKVLNASADGNKTSSQAETRSARRTTNRRINTRNTKEEALQTKNPSSKKQPQATAIKPKSTRKSNRLSKQLEGESEENVIGNVEKDHLTSSILAKDLNGVQTDESNKFIGNPNTSNNIEISDETNKENNVIIGTSTLATEIETVQSQNKSKENLKTINDKEKSTATNETAGSLSHDQPKSNNNRRKIIKTTQKTLPNIFNRQRKQLATKASKTTKPQKSNTKSIDENSTPIESIKTTTTTTPNENNQQENLTKTHKFFHRTNSNKNNNNGTADKLSNVRAANGILKTKPQRVRSSQVWREQVYEFLSQSQTSDSDGSGGRFLKPADPMQDVIQKLIEEGKVVVAKNAKGKGRPRIKGAGRPKTVQNKAKFKAKEKLAAAKQNNKAKKNGVGDRNAGHNMPTNKNAPRPPGDVNGLDNDHFEHHFMAADDDDDDLPINADVDVDYNLNQTNPQVSEIRQAPMSAEHQEGTFSNLAKSVLINQAGRSSAADAQRIKAQRLLAMAKKIISTPKNPKTPPLQAGLQADFSPIPWPSKRPATKASPWRVDEDANLPRVFNFSRCTGNLPSFSSDYIPPTPRKETSKNRSSLPELQETPPMEPLAPPQDQPYSPLPLPHIPIRNSASSTPLVQNNFSVPSSFSSNDSNAENQPPCRAEENQNENADIFNLKQLPNPRRALTYRSPLKAINILEVVHLPPLQKSILEKSQTEVHDPKDMAARDDDNLFKTPQKQIKDKKRKKKSPSPQRDLFGFEEFLSQTEVSSQESDTEQHSAHERSAKEKSMQYVENIHNKLNNLRKLRPNTSSLETSLQHPNGQTKKLPNLFNDPGVEKISNGQKTIRQMLCSTMIDERPSTSKKALEELKKRNLPPKVAAGFNCATNFDSNISELFKDPEPETTFNEDDAHRTYIRPYKRKRRLRENKLVFVLDSDESGDEGNNSKSPQKRKKREKHHNSHETDTSSEQHQKPAKRKRQCKENPELKTFVEEFQEMCKEVESFELVVETST